MGYERHHYCKRVKQFIVFIHGLFYVSGGSDSSFRIQYSICRHGNCVTAEDDIGMASVSKTYPTGSPDPEKGKAFYCSLFSDTVTEHLCELRRNELIAKGAFSCEGCPMAIHGADRNRAAQSAL